MTKLEELKTAYGKSWEAYGIVRKAYNEADEANRAWAAYGKAYEEAWTTYTEDWRAYYKELEKEISWRNIK